MEDEEINEMKHKMEILEGKLDYYMTVAKNHFQSPKEKFALANLENGEFMTAKDIQNEINALRSMKHQLNKKNGLILLEEEKTSVNVKNSKHERRFMKLYYVSLRNLTKELDVSTLGLLQKFIQHIRIDGTNALIGSSIKSDWYEIVGLNKTAFNKHFKILEDLSVIKFVKHKGIFINPYYARYGNEIEKETLDLFSLEFNNGELKLRNQIAE